MNSIEKFGLISGIIGLVADIVGLVSFLAGIWQPTSVNSGIGEMPFVYQVIFAITILYGWFSISWILLRKSFVTRKHKKDKLISVSMSISIATGVLLFPLIMAWWAVPMKADAAQQRTEIEKNKITQATQAALGTPAPTPTGYLASSERVDTSGWYCAIIPAQIIISFSISLVLCLLMPTVYSDMPEIGLL
jgi:hypothetical protein